MDAVFGLSFSSPEFSFVYVLYVRTRSVMSMSTAACSESDGDHASAASGPSNRLSKCARQQAAECRVPNGIAPAESESESESESDSPSSIGSDRGRESNAVGCLDGWMDGWACRVTTRGRLCSGHGQAASDGDLDAREENENENEGGWEGRISTASA